MTTNITDLVASARGFADRSLSRHALRAVLLSVADALEAAAAREAKLVAALEAISSIKLSSTIGVTDFGISEDRTRQILGLRDSAREALAELRTVSQDPGGSRERGVSYKPLTDEQLTSYEQLGQSKDWITSIDAIIFEQARRANRLAEKAEALPPTERMLLANAIVHYRGTDDLTASRASSSPAAER